MDKKGKFKLKTKNKHLLDIVESNKNVTEKLKGVRQCLAQKADVNTRSEFGKTPLHLAVKRDSVLLIKLLIKHGADVNARDDYGTTPLHDAVRYREASVVELLLDKGADLNAESGREDTPLHLATRLGLLKTVKLLLQKGADINAHDEFGLTLLHKAASAGEISVVEFFLGQGTNVNATCTSGSTPLHRAAKAQNVSVVQLLLDRGAEVNSTNSDGETPLHGAARTGNFPITELLIERGANVNSRKTEGDSPLHEALRSTNEDVYRLLLDKGAAVNVSTRDKKTPLYLAVSTRNNLATMLLLQKNAGLVPKKPGRTLIHEAARFGNLYVLELLLKSGDDINKQDADGRSPLHEAAHSLKSSTVEFLLEHGADANAKTVKGNTPLYITIEQLTVVYALQRLNGTCPPEYDTVHFNKETVLAKNIANTSVIELLLRKGAKVDLQNEREMTALHLAAVLGAAPLADVLLKNGADVSALAQGKTPLHKMTGFGQVLQTTELLLNSGANVNLQDDTGNTALHNAVQLESSAVTEVVKLMLDRDPDLNLKNLQGETALHLAVKLDLTVIVEDMIRKGANINARTNNRTTPLHQAARFGKISIAKMLLTKKADVNAQTADGETPLHMAVRHQHGSLAVMLVHRGADVTIRNRAGDTPFSYALLFLLKSHARVVNFLQMAERQASYNLPLVSYKYPNVLDSLASSTEKNAEFKYSKKNDSLGWHGQLYETKIVSLIYIRLLNHEEIEQDILLGVNVDGIGAMDDICIRYRVKGRQRPVVVFMQAKHRENPKEKVKDKDLWANIGDFSLQKYFLSYLVIKELFQVNQEDPLFDGEFDNIDCFFVLYTPAYECITKKKAVQNEDKILHKLINTNESVKPFQYNYNQADVERLTNIAVDKSKNEDSDTNSDSNETEHIQEQVKDFFSKLLIYPCQAKEEDVEDLVKKYINRYYNNENKLNHHDFVLHTNTIFMKAHHEIQKWWMLKDEARYLRSTDFFRSAKLECLDQLLMSASNAMDHFKFIVNVEFSQILQKHSPNKISKVFSTIISRLLKFNQTNSNLITINTDFKQVIIDLLQTDPSQAMCSSQRYMTEDSDNEQHFLYSKRIGTCEVGGVLYRMKMLRLVLLRVLNHEQIDENSKLGTKIQGISAMNDICLRYNLKGQHKPTVLFMQLVHKDDPEKAQLIDEAVWKNPGEFSLGKYFKSYLTIREKFQVGNKDPIFDEDYSGVHSYFIAYTSAKENFEKKKHGNTLNEVVKDLTKTKDTEEPFQYDYSENDINDLTELTIIDQIKELGKKLGAVLPKCLPSKMCNDNLLGDKLIMKYHLAIAKEVLQEKQSENNEEGEDQPANKKDSLWQFRPEFFTSTLKHLVVLRSFLKESMASQEIKLPRAFGNKDMTFSGSNDVKIKNRIKTVADELINLLKCNKDTKIVEINNENVGRGKLIERGIIELDGGIGGAVGNLLVLDTESNMLKFNLECNLKDNATLFLNELTDKRHKPFNEDLGAYRFKINVDGFPKYSFDVDEYDKLRARDFLNKFWFYPHQEKEDKTGQIFDEEIKAILSKKSTLKIRQYQEKLSNISLTTFEEIQRWWLLPNESPYLSRASELFERAELSDMYNLLHTVINYMYISDIQSIDIKVQVKDNETEQIHEIFKKMVRNLFALFDPLFEEQIAIRGYDYDNISLKSTLSLKIHPDMEWVALSVMSTRASNLSNEDIKHCLVARASPGRGAARPQDGFMLYELYHYGRIYSFKDCIKDSAIEFEERRL